MKIALFHFYSSQPTPANQEIAKALRARGHTVCESDMDTDGNLVWHDDQLTFGVVQGPHDSQSSLSAIPVLRTLTRRVEYYKFSQRVRDFLREYAPDIVHVNPTFGAWAIPLGFSTTKFVLDIRQTGEGEGKGFGGALRDWQAIYTWRFCAKHVYQRACFPHAHGAERVLGKNWQRWGAAVPMGISETFLRAARPVQVPAKHEPVRFVYIGTLSRLRHLEHLLEAAQVVRAQTNAFQIVLYGSDEANGFYQQLIRDMQIESFVQIKAALPYERVPEVVASYDVALAYIPDQPAWRYHPTLKIREYCALGMPVLATDLEPNREWIQPNVTGLLARDTPVEFGAKMLQLIQDRALLAALMKNAAQKRRGVTWADAARMYEELVYAPILAARDGWQSRKPQTHNHISN